VIPPDEIEAVLSIAGRTLGNPEVRAAKAKRDEAVGRLGAAARRGEPPEVLDRLEAEFRAANAGYARIKGWQS
jgi:hypothetical protein